LSCLGWLGLRIDYGASKLMSLLLLAASSSILYLALRTFSPARTPASPCSRCSSSSG
jgi:hypothetical protein